jgi:hypothetical protein
MGLLYAVELYGILGPRKHGWQARASHEFKKGSFRTEIHVGIVTIRFADRKKPGGWG